MVPVPVAADPFDRSGRTGRGTGCDTDVISRDRDRGFVADRSAAVFYAGQPAGQ